VIETRWEGTGITIRGGVNLNRGSYDVNLDGRAIAQWVLLAIATSEIQALRFSPAERLNATYAYLAADSVGKYRAVSFWSG
jgi:hypothetical protein